MGDLLSCNFKRNYQTIKDNFITDFYVPAFTQSVLYDRAVGYFNSAVFQKIFIHTEVFLHNKGKIRLIIGSAVSPTEYDAILDGLKKQDLSYYDNHSTHLFLELWREDPTIAELVTYLVAKGQLEIKFALTNTESEMFHLKIGVFTDSNNNKVAFTGSMNETINGTYKNIESFDVYISDRDFDRVQDKQQEFDAYWNGITTNTLIVIPISEETIAFLKTKSPSYMPSQFFKDIKDTYYKEYQDTQIKIDDIKEPHIPKTFNGKDFSLQNHQQDALKRWYNNDYKGILKLATGSGKTITAICGAVHLYQQGKIKYLVIVVPLINLANQWTRELKKFGFNPIQCHSGNGGWRKGLNSLFTDMSFGEEKICTFVTVRNTFLMDDFQNGIMEKIRQQNTGTFDNMMFIGDECHGHTSDDMTDKISEYYYKLGLSATPEHYRRSKTNKKLFKAYGNLDSPVAIYTIENALQQKILVPYNYYPIVVNLTEQEAEIYKKKNHQLAVLLNAPKIDSESVQSRIRELRKIVANASNKITILKKLISSGKIIKGGCLFYSGTGKTIDGQNSQISEISSILNNKGWRIAKIISGTSSHDREELIRSFAYGGIDALLAMKCLDEGIDIPSCQTTVITASSNDPREFVQRRGRILRKYGGKHIAFIYDFIVRNPYEKAASDSDTVTLLRKEISRAYEFGRLALNQEKNKEVEITLQDYLKSENLKWGRECIYNFPDLEADYESTTEE